MSDIVLEARDVWKSFDGVQALAGVDLQVRAGTVHCLVGENGSGKSTLTKVFAGVVAPDRGTIRLGDLEATVLTPRRSLAQGVRVIYQDLALFPNLTVAENLTFTGSGRAVSAVRWRQLRQRAERALASVEVDVDPRALLGDLPIAERQLVAIARAVSSEGRVILMDEPTAALTRSEIERLLELVHRLRERGVSFVFISHKLREVMDVADDITVIRNGKVVATGPGSRFTAARISYLMSGVEVGRERRELRAPADGPPLLSTRGLSLAGVFEDVEIDLHQGRVVGLAGLLGSGRTAIGLALAGLVRPDAGRIWFRGRLVGDASDLDTIQYVPDDRLAQGLFLDWPIMDNIAVQNLDEMVGERRFLDRRRKRQLARRWREELGIRAPDVTAAVSTLSGGNQQRVLMARALAPQPEVLLLNNPTVGVDVASRADIHALVRRVADAGTAVMVISEDFPELLDTCDDVLVVKGGRITGRYRVQELDDDRLWELVVGEGSAA